MGSGFDHESSWGEGSESLFKRLVVLRTRFSSSTAPALSNMQYRLHRSPRSKPITMVLGNGTALVVTCIFRCIAASSRIGKISLAQA
jgi:hypothetical protein